MKSLTKILVSGIAALSLAGCATNYTKESINRLPEKQVKELYARAEKPVEQSMDNYLNREVGKSSLSYEETSKIIGKYAGNLPAQKLTLYLNGEQRELDTTGPLNQYADELQALESMIPDNQKRARWILGDAKTGGLLAVDYAGQGSFVLEVEKSKNILSGKETYTAKVIGGKDKFNARESNNDWSVLFNTGIDTGIGAAFGVPGLGLTNLTDWVIGNMNKSDPYKNSILTDDIKYIGLNGKTADVISMLRRAKDVGADSLALSNENGNLVGVYTKGSQVYTSNGGINVEISEAGESLLEHVVKSTIKGAILGTTRTGKEKTETKEVDNPNSGVHGSDSGLPAGTASGTGVGGSDSGLPATGN